jgi:NTP pyrophosphatase (non-canonical NTP hydrolase)
MNKWQVMTSPIGLRRLGKLGEESGELVAVVCRSVIQGLDEVDPGTGKMNRQRLHEEIADVLAQCFCAIRVLSMDDTFILQRARQKQAEMVQWEDLYTENVNPLAPRSLFDKEALGRLVLEASGGMHGGVAEALANEWVSLAEEVERLRALSVENIVLDVTPGDDGMGHEVFAKSVDQVVDKLSSMGAELEDYHLGIRRPSSAGHPGSWSLGDYQPGLDGSYRDIDHKDHGGVLRVVWRMDGDERSPECEARAIAIVAALNGASINAEPVAEVCSASHDDAQAGERSVRPLVDLSEYEYGTKLYATDFKNGKQT